MIPITLWFLCIESIPHFLFTLLFGAAILLLDILLCAFVFEFKRRHGRLALFDWIRMKHHLILLTGILSSLLFLQTYLAIAAIVLFIWQSHRLWEVDMRILRMEEYPTLQRHAEQRRNRSLIELARLAQESAADETRAAFFARYHDTREKIQASNAEIFLHTKQFSRSYRYELLLPIGLIASFATVVRLVALLSLDSICYDAASGFPLVFLLINAILTETALLAGLVYGTILWETRAPFRRYSLTFSLVLLYLAIAALLVATAFGRY